MSEPHIRIGIVGAGANTRLRHIPGFRTQGATEIVSIVNRSRASSEKIASEFGIPVVYDTWRDLVEADDTNAIFIGTWPYMHCPVTIAALEAGKHVLTEARMAMNVDEAREMLAVSRAHPGLVTQIVPSPFTFKFDQVIGELVSSGYLGDLLSVELRATTAAFVEHDGAMSWRQDRELSGYNILTMGIWYEALMRWVGPAARVSAMTSVSAKRRRGESGQVRAVTVPDHVEVLCQMAMGGQAHITISAITGLAPSGDAWLFGSEGTLHLEMSSQTLYGGRRGDSGLTPIEIPAEKQGSWRVEEEFIRACRGEEQVKLTTFEDGVAYMEFTEAVTRSAQSGSAIDLPL